MHTETICTTIVNQRNSHDNFSQRNGPDLNNSSFTRHRKLITEVEDIWLAFTLSKDDPFTITISLESNKGLNERSKSD